MKKLIYAIPVVCILACSSDTSVKGNVTMTFKDSIVEFTIKANDEVVGEVSCEYSFLGDTILIGKPDNCDKAIIKGNKLLFIEESGTTELKKIK